jgi:hypothetical protein
MVPPHAAGSIPINVVEFTPRLALSEDQHDELSALGMWSDVPAEQAAS